MKSFPDNSIERLILYFHNSKISEKTLRKNLRRKRTDDFIDFIVKQSSTLGAGLQHE